MESISTIRCTCHNEMVPVSQTTKYVVCDEILDSIREGVKNLREGKTWSWAEVKAGLDLLDGGLPLPRHGDTPYYSAEDCHLTEDGGPPCGEH